MAFAVTATNYAFLGTVTSTKPLTYADGSAIPAGATLAEVDANNGNIVNTLYWDGSNWQYRGPADQSIAPTLAKMDEMLTQMRLEFMALKATIVNVAASFSPSTKDIVETDDVTLDNPVTSVQTQ